MISVSEPSSAPHPRTRLDDNFASPIRFSLMASLGDGIELDFAALFASVGSVAKMLVAFTD